MDATQQTALVIVKGGDWFGIENMCHLILLLPLIALPIWWLLPLSVAAPVYAAIAIVAGVVYYLVIRAVRAPLVMDPDRLIGCRGEVVSLMPKPRIRIEGEIWKAKSSDPLVPGEYVQVTARNGVTLVVHPMAEVSAEQSTHQKS